MTCTDPEPVSDNMTVPTEPEIPRLFEVKAMDMESPTAKGAHKANSNAVSNVR